MYRSSNLTGGIWTKWMSVISRWGTTCVRVLSGVSSCRSSLSDGTVGKWRSPSYDTTHLIIKLYDVIHAHKPPQRRVWSCQKKEKPPLRFWFAEVFTGKPNKNLPSFSFSKWPKTGTWLAELNSFWWNRSKFHNSEPRLLYEIIRFFVWSWAKSFSKISKLFFSVGGGEVCVCACDLASAPF